MTEPILTDTPAAEQPLARPPVHVGLDGVHIEFPEGWWDHSSHDLVIHGRPMREHRIDELALGIAMVLRKQLAGRRTSSSGLVGPDGQPL